MINSGALSNCEYRDLYFPFLTHPVIERRRSIEISGLMYVLSRDINKAVSVFYHPPPPSPLKQGLIDKEDILDIKEKLKILVSL